MIAATLFLGLTEGQAAAAEGAWFVGGAYVVRSGGLDLDTAAGRDAYLAHVERAAKAVCLTEETRGLRARCAAAAVADAIEASTPRARKALSLALEQRGRPGIETAAFEAE
ncbi:MAG: UrcA family protein [Micropepsaceae bacterium]